MNRKEVSRAVEMQRRSYNLLKWMAKAVEEGFIQFETAHCYTSLPDAAQEWILRHYLNIPASAGVAQEYLQDFCQFFSTYLETSFDLVANPGQQLFSPNALLSYEQLVGEGTAPQDQEAFSTLIKRELGD